jgi:uncharacterized protein (DUF2267 family)
MRYGTFMTEVERAAGLSRPEAERAARAVLETLSERLAGGEAADVAAFLPQELRPLLTSAPEPAEGFDLGEFVRRVAEREGVDEQTALDHARAVFVALGMAVAPGELRDMAAQLSKDFGPLLKAAGLGRERELTRNRLVRRVAELTGLDAKRAHRATEAVLGTLAVRISDGEVEQLMDHLPADLIPALERGLGERRQATRMSADEFVARDAEQEGVDADQAREHTRAVFTALREAVGGDEFSDLAAELSADYEPLLAGASR